MRKKSKLQFVMTSAKSVKKKVLQKKNSPFLTLVFNGLTGS
jgi:hypothetical protein